MNDSYLKIFDNLFYDINSNSDVKNTIEQASHVLGEKGWKNKTTYKFHRGWTVEFIYVKPI